ncbi:hypothetical protein FHS43_004597 [Streptosporangium becharense]|uniref:Gram-positive cocci surface proteins LPxTG domain-containing protein n=1 Tax=Streptosporangium becharense TaxID=1816182 RepID=A0A7W9MIJ3_9ACTN|nr:hypothetical protein [Streptosporangium becharense]MBB2913299.1 hypothetical protein [Streptosporangium becharense]MBB5822282.1 hypothetical protein [Streptosporangium becharense]
MKQPTEVIFRWAVTAATAAVTVAVTAGPATAAGADGEVQLSPYRTEPGATVKITVFECEAPAFAESEGFVEDVELEDDGLGVAVGWAHIDRDALGGSYSVEADCRGGGGRQFGTFNILGKYGFEGYGPETGGGGLALAGDAAGGPGGADVSSPGGADAGGARSGPQVRAGAEAAGEPGETSVPPLGWGAAGAVALVGGGGLALAVRRRRAAGRD